MTKWNDGYGNNKNEVTNYFMIYEVTQYITSLNLKNNSVKLGRYYYPHLANDEIEVERN